MRAQGRKSHYLRLLPTPPPPHPVLNLSHYQLTLTANADTCTQSELQRERARMCVCVYLTYFCLVFGAPPNSNEVLGFFKLKYHFILAPVILPSACFYLDCLSVLLKGERPHFTLQCLHVIDNTFKTKENYYFLNAETTYMLNLS